MPEWRLHQAVGEGIGHHDNGRAAGRHLEFRRRVAGSASQMRIVAALAKVAIDSSRMALLALARALSDGVSFIWDRRAKLVA